MNPLLQKSLSLHNYEAAKRKATLEEESYPSYIPKTPKFEKPKVIPLSAGIYNMCKNMLCELKP